MVTAFLGLVAAVDVVCRVCVCVGGGVGVKLHMRTRVIVEHFVQRCFSVHVCVCVALRPPVAYHCVTGSGKSRRGEERRGTGRRGSW